MKLCESLFKTLNRSLSRVILSGAEGSLNGQEILRLRAAHSAQDDRLPFTVYRLPLTVNSFQGFCQGFVLLDLHPKALPATGAFHLVLALHAGQTQGGFTVGAGPKDMLGGVGGEVRLALGA